MHDHRFLEPFRALFEGAERAEFLIPEEAPEFSRQACDGLILGRGYLKGLRVGMGPNDFRVNGGSFRHRGFATFRAVSRDMDLFWARRSLYFGNSIAASDYGGADHLQSCFRCLAQDSTASRHAIVRDLCRGKMSWAWGNRFGLGQYRIAVAKETHINLTGPEVMKLFLGQKFDFEDFLR